MYKCNLIVKSKEYGGHIVEKGMAFFLFTLKFFYIFYI